MPPLSCLHHLSGAKPPLREGIAFNHYDAYSVPAQHQLLAWRERMGHLAEADLTPGSNVTRALERAYGLAPNDVRHYRGWTL